MRLNRLEFIKLTIAALLSGTIDKRGTPVVQCSQVPVPWRVKALAVPINGYDGSINCECDYPIGSVIQINAWGHPEYYSVNRVGIIGREVNVGVSLIGSWLPLIGR